MKPSIETLGRILYSPSQYVIPVFQRQYRWEAKEWAKMWESLQEIQQPAKTGNHFMGFLVVMPGLPQPGRNTIFFVIDGQQRLTTLTILLAAIRNVAKRTGQRELADEIHEYYLIHPIKKGDDRYRLLPKARDSKDYQAVISGEGGPNGRVGQALSFFEERLDELPASGDQHLRSLLNTITQRLEFMNATLETENAYNIFKSLNSIGVPLAQSDLIRNFVFMHLPPDEHDDFDRDSWAPLERRFVSGAGTLDEEMFSRFFRDFMMSNGEYIRPSDTFAAFESRYEATGFSPQTLARDLDRYAGYYEVNNGIRPDTDRAVTQALAGLNALESSTTYPLLLKLFGLRYEGALDSADLAAAIRMLQSFIIRRFITGESSRGYGQLFVRAGKLESDNLLQTLNDYLVGRTWPEDRRFREAFVQFPLYERGYARHILEILERSSNHKEPADLSTAQIEHIMPQTLNNNWHNALGEDWERIYHDWLHRPGNLTLTGYNAPLSNASFNDKRKLYADSNITITRQLADYPVWGEDEMQQRGQKLAETAAGIWPGPAPTAKPANSPDDDDDTPQRPSEMRQLQLRFWQQFHDLVRAESDNLSPRKTRASSFSQFSLGRWEFTLIAGVNRKKRRVDVNLYITGEQNKAHFHALENQKLAIEQAVGEPLTWWELPEKASSYITLYRQDSSLQDEADWPAQQAWLLEKLELFYRVFRPIVMPMGREG